MNTIEKGFIIICADRDRYVTSPVFVPFNVNNVVHRVMQFMQDNPDKFKIAIDTLKLTKEDAVRVLHHFYGTDGDLLPMLCFISATRTTTYITPNGPITAQCTEEASEHIFVKHDIQQMANCLYMHGEFNAYILEHSSLAKFAPNV